MFDGLTVVFVEDDPTVLAGSEQALQLAGLNVQAFPSAELAYRQLKPDFPGIVVSDVRLPGMSGMDLLKAVKALDTHLNFIGKLQDTLDAGVGNLVDADLAKESAKLQSLQTKQQLGVQALSIANSSSSTLLGLFR